MREPEAYSLFRQRGALCRRPRGLLTEEPTKPRERRLGISKGKSSRYSSLFIREPDLRYRDISDGQRATVPGASGRCRRIRGEDAIFPGRIQSHFGNHAVGDFDNLELGGRGELAVGDRE